MAPRQPDSKRSIPAGILSWLLPGLGHWWLGHRGLGVVFFLAVSLPYWTGLAFGGVLPSVNVRTNKWLYLAELGVGGYTLPLTWVSRALERPVLQQAGLSEAPDPADVNTYITYLEAATARGYMSYYPESDIATIYLAAAGLLNLLVILDALARAQTGLPTYAREVAAVRDEVAR